MISSIRRAFSSLRSQRWFRVVKGVLARYKQDGGSWLAAVITYYGFIAMIPLLLLGVALLGALVANDPAERLQWTVRLARAFPGLSDQIGPSLDAIAKRAAGAGALGVAGLAWAGTRAMEASSYALGVVFRRERGENTIKQKVRAFVSTISIGTAALAGIVVSSFVGGWEATPPVGYVTKTVGVLIAVAADVAVFLIAYRILTPKPGPSYRSIWPGALLAAGGWAALKLGGAWYVATQTRSAGGTYGTFAAVVALLALLFIAARVFLYGAELDAVLAEEREVDEEPEVRRVPMRDDGDRMEASTTDLVRQIAEDAATIVKGQVELAKKELVEAVTSRLTLAAAFGAAAVLGLLAVGFGGVAAVSVLRPLLGHWQAWVVVGASFLALGGAAVLGAWARVRRSSLLPETRRLLGSEQTTIRVPEVAKKS